MLDQRLQEAAEAVKAALVDSAPPPLEEPLKQRSRWVRWRPVLVPATAFVAVLVVVGATALVLRGGGDPVVEGSADPPPLDIEWSRLPHDEAVLGGEDGASMQSVSAGGPGLVAVGVTGGGVGEFSGVRDGAVWTSDDGITWTRVPHDEAVFGGAGDQHIRSVTTGGPGLVAVGHGFDESGPSGVDPAIWISPDGINWSRIVHDPEFVGRRGGAAHSVTAGGPGLVAVGSDGAAAVWTSFDGLTWSRVPHDPTVFGSEGTEMNSVIVGGPGLVAVGSAGDYPGSSCSPSGGCIHNPGSRVAVVWTSVDGITWSRVPHDEAVFGGGEGQHCRASDVVAGGPGYVAVGACELFSVGSEGEDGLVAHGDRAVVWTSPDGLTWSRVPHDEDAFDPDPSIDADRAMRNLTVTPSGLVAVGTDTWTSADGITWHLDSDRIGGNEVTLGGPGLVAVGDDDDVAAVWVADLGS